MNKLVKFFAVIVLSSAILGASVIAVPSSAQAGILEFFFPSLRETPPDPGVTLQAPFAYEGEKKKLALIDDEASSDKPEPLDTPHRMSAEISEWLTSIVSEVLTFEADDYKSDMQSEALYFDDTGRRAYLGFLETNKMIKVLDSQQYHIRSFVEDTPTPLNEGAVSGVYRWLYEVPVMVSYMDRDMKDYTKSDATTQQVILTLQVGRSSTASDLGVVIEQWDAKIGEIKTPNKK